MALWTGTVPTCASARQPQRSAVLICDAFSSKCDSTPSRSGQEAALRYAHLVNSGRTAILSCRTQLVRFLVTTIFWARVAREFCEGDSPCDQKRGPPQWRTKTGASERLECWLSSTLLSSYGPCRAHILRDSDCILISLYREANRPTFYFLWHWSRRGG